MRPAMSEEDLKWRRRCDARTLAEAEQIKADKDRYKGAIMGAKEIASEEIKQAETIAKVAGMKLPKAPKDVVVENNKGTYYPQPTNTVANFNKRNYSNPATIGKL